MKTISIILFFIGFIFLTNPISEAQAQDRGDGNFGAGVMVGQPTGLSGKLWLGDSNAFHGGIAWQFSPTRATRFHMHFDYARYNFDFIDAQTGTLAFYYGVGGRILTGGTNDRIGVRFPFGLNYQFDDNPIEIFAEVAPILDLSPGTHLRGNSGAGLRYYFGSN